MTTVRQPRLRRGEQAEANRAVVLSAARDVFSQRGYAAATLDQIAEAAGFSKGVVYSQFTSKADLFLHVLEARIDARAAENQAAVDRYPGAELGDIVRELHRLMSRSDPAWRIAVTEFRIAASRDPDLRVRYEAAHRRTVERLAVVLEQIYAAVGHVAPVPIEDVATVILALDVGIVVEDASTARPVPPDSLDALLRRLVFGA